jgi:transposase
MGRYNLTEFEWRVISPLLPNKPCGVKRVDDRRVLNGIFWVLRSGARWADLPERYGPYTTCYNRFNRWRKAGVCDRIMDAVTKAYDGDVQMIDTSVVRVHQHACGCKKGWRSLHGLFSGRIDDQDTHPRRCTRPANPARHHAGTNVEYADGRRAAVTSAGEDHAARR